MSVEIPRVPSPVGEGAVSTALEPGERPKAVRGSPQWLFEYQARIVITDIAMIAIVVAASIQLRWGFDSVDLAAGLTWAASTGIALVIGLLWALALVVNGAWDRKILGAGSSEYRRIFNASCGVFFMLVTASYLFQADLARGYVAILIPLGVVALVAGRVSARVRLQRMRRRDTCMSNVLVIGSEASAARLVGVLARSPQEGMRATGVFVPDETLRSADGGTVAAELTRVRAAIGAAEAHVVAIASSSAFGNEHVRALAWDLEGSGITIALVPALTDVAGPRVHIKPVSGLPLMYVEEPRFRGPKLVVKTILDRLGALLILCMTAPVMLVVAALVKREDRGPVFFKQQRVGLDGRNFKVLKFRSMTPNADKLIDEVRTEHGQTGDVFYKSASDHRITRVGKVLRKTSLDELPQLINVLFGEMSLVGPRPLVPGEGSGVDGYLERRMLVKPGLTGLWQVSGRSDVAGDERVRLDMYYVENWSLAGDLTILARTLKTVVKREGAY